MKIDCGMRELGGGHDFAARSARQIGDDTLDFGDLVLFYPVFHKMPSNCL
jgi:hypothetical protein